MSREPSFAEASAGRQGARRKGDGEKGLNIEHRTFNVQRRMNKKRDGEGRRGEGVKGLNIEHRTFNVQHRMNKKRDGERETGRRGEEAGNVLNQSGWAIYRSKASSAHRHRKPGEPDHPCGADR